MSEQKKLVLIGKQKSFWTTLLLHSCYLNIKMVW